MRTLEKVAIALPIFFMGVVGPYFYKGGGSIYPTEMTYLLYVGIVALLWPRRTVLSSDGFYLYLGLLLTAYVAYSLTAGRPLQWVVRQSALFFYFVAGYCIARRIHFTGQAPWFGRVLLATALVGLPVSTVIRVLDPVNVASQDFQIPAFLYLVATVLHRYTGDLVKFGFASTVMVGLSIVFGHMSTVLAIGTMCIGAQAFKIRSKAVVAVLLSIGSVVALLALYLAKTDDVGGVNTVWRLVYWRESLLESYHRSYMLFGTGFGVPLFPQDSPFFLTLIYQVAQNETFDTQLYTVPPHNFVVALIKYIGLVGLLPLLYQLGKVLMYRLRHQDPESIRLQLCLLGLVITALLHQFLEVPYFALPFWIVFLLARLRQRADRLGVSPG